jgi:hypothetical protein
MAYHNIKFQTSDLVPPPFAHAIELKIDLDSNCTKYEFEISYLGREDLSLEEIEEEGFTENDDYSLNGSLPEFWIQDFQKLIDTSKKSNKKEIFEDEDYWEIDDSFFPANPIYWKEYLEEIHQAILEDNKFEKPLEIIIKRQNQESPSELHIIGSFVSKSLEFKFVNSPNSNSGNKPWTELNKILKTIYSGEILYANASNKIPKRTGIFLNLGDDLWLEVGKSYLIDPRKLTSLFN